MQIIKETGGAGKNRAHILRKRSEKVFLSQDNQAERALPRGIRLRRGTAEDEFATFEVMRRSMGYEMVWAHHSDTRTHLRHTDQVSYWVAEETPRFGANRLVGYSRSLVREGIWSLTEFFVLPGHHRRGIGRALLHRCLEDGERCGAEKRLVLASQHPGADSLYIRYAGCYPRLPMLLLAGPLLKLSIPPDTTPIFDSHLLFSTPDNADRLSAVSTSHLRAEPLVLTPQIQEILDGLDREVIGYARPQEHQFWAEKMGGIGGAARLFRRVSNATGGEGTVAGYAYIGAHRSGPMLALRPEDQPGMLAHIAQIQQRLSRTTFETGLFGAVDHYLPVAGTNETMLNYLLNCGWQIVFHYLFMSSYTPGSMERYVCHNPLYFL